ncbi:MAG: J domain-containing protein [Clostridia bacterium]|nr:J domain-containing protein [Clostridia bacterium]
MTHYEVLGVKKTASTSEIKDAYKKLVKKYHPDVYVGDKTFAEKKIKEINAAYDVLSDPEQKQEYDEKITPQPSPSYSTNYTSYTTAAPRYNYTSSTNNTQKSKRNAQARGSKYSYENYRKTYNTTNFGSYSYTNRYTDYHRSKTPNSNYSSNDNSSKNYAENIANTFSNYSKSVKTIIIIVIIVFFITFFIDNTIQLASLLDNKQVPVTSPNTHSATIEKPEENYETRNPYLEPEETTPSSSSSKFPSLEEFDINDVFTDEELMVAFLEYGGDKYSTFEEFKEAIKIAYYTTYIKPFISSY